MTRGRDVRRPRRAGSVLLAAAAGLLCAALAPLAGAQEPDKEDFAEFEGNAALALGIQWTRARMDGDEDARLDDGNVAMAVGMLRLGAPDDAAPLPLAGYTFPLPDKAVIRLLLDPSNGSAFGYRLQAVPVSAATLAIRVEIRPLGPSEAGELKRLPKCRDCPSPRLVSSLPVRPPPTRVLRHGEVMVVDLLVRAATGEKVVDVVKFSAERTSREAFAALRQRIGEAWRHARAGDELLARGSFEPALAEYTQALTLQPDSGTHLRRGHCYEGLDRPERAQREYERAVQLDPSEADGWHDLGMLLHRRGQYGKAAGSYRRALELRPDWAVARRDLAVALLDRGQLDEAFKEYRKARQQGTSVAESNDLASVKARNGGAQQYVFARLYATEGDLEAALGALRRAKEAGFRDLFRARQEPAFQPLLDDPRFVSLVGHGSRS